MFPCELLEFMALKFDVEHFTVYVMVFVYNLFCLDYLITSNSAGLPSIVFYSKSKMFLGTEENIAILIKSLFIAPFRSDHFIPWTLKYIIRICFSR